ncbi:hypothetical protein, partial [Gemmiger sp. An194]|uniref:hypothetical protein n=1 Tax=Gemmiger sp. An194 TaxID=1965582 RepID=UPI0019CFF667
KTWLATPLFSLIKGRFLVRFPSSAPRRNGLRSIQKVRPFGRAFLIPLRHFSFSPQNFAVQTFAGAPPCGPRRIFTYSLFTLHWFTQKPWSNDRGFLHLCGAAPFPGTARSLCAAQKVCYNKKKSQNNTFFTAPACSGMARPV